MSVGDDENSILYDGNEHEEASKYEPLEYGDRDIVAFSKNADFVTLDDGDKVYFYHIIQYDLPVAEEIVKRFKSIIKKLKKACGKNWKYLQCPTHPKNKENFTIDDLKLGFELEDENDIKIQELKDELKLAGYLERIKNFKNRLPQYTEHINISKGLRMRILEKAQSLEKSVKDKLTRTKRRLSLTLRRLRGRGRGSRKNSGRGGGKKRHTKKRHTKKRHTKKRHTKKRHTKKRMP